ncbi:MAG: LLM class F420-dependent oxidoreductase [Rhodospirillaceae bacterium]|nr:LLM class F420-dependent oxidoreductase [Rhodospirillaceae bacterium]MDD9928120.1 LLM class F420-dependent oxidoreductase [Rhodospirillaceae bacterium]
MKFGLRYCNAGRYVYPANAVELVQAGEAAGFESAWTVDHVVVPEGYESAYPYSDDGKMAGGKNDMPIPDPLIWMAYVAAATSKINLATGILIIPQRNPVVAAKQIATLDLLSGGRTLLGIGVGWLEEEFNAIGVPFGDRGQRTDEYIYAMQELWATDRSTYESDFIKFTDVHSQPKPVNRSIPIIVGGHSKAAARRAGRLGDGFFPARGASPELIDLVRRTAEEHGRDPNAIEITASLPEDLDMIPELAASGVTRLLVPVLPMFGVAGIINSVDEVARWADIIDKYRDI